MMKPHVHLLGVGGTLMGSLVLLLQEKGFHVSGSDHKIYPPMDKQLARLNVEVTPYEAFELLTPLPDMVIVGNAVSRGNPAVEYLLSSGLPYYSAPAFLADQFLKTHWVIAVAGTHGKTSTTSMVAWILEQADMNPSFLIGGISSNFNQSARLTSSLFFVIEADEYDTAFFDKRSKFIHYHPNTLLINNVEFDHADIFEDLASIQKQFHHLIRTLPATGQIIVPSHVPAIEAILQQGCWTPIVRMQDDTEWQAHTLTADYTEFTITHQGVMIGVVKWTQVGLHNMENALGAIIAARHAGVPPVLACEALSTFTGVKRRMELIYTSDEGSMRIYDDFAHHPTAIACTLAGWRAHTDHRLRVVIELGSNTMKQGFHQDELAASVALADEVIWWDSNLPFPIESIIKQTQPISRGFKSVESIVQYLSETLRPHDDLIIMSNSRFDGLHYRLINALKLKKTE